jgi:carboxylesterase
VHPDVAGVVCINPYIEPPAASFLDLLRDWLANGADMLPAIGADIARPGVKEPSYAQLPVAPMLSLLEAVGRLAPELDRIVCPLLLFTSRTDHVVPPASSDLLAERVSGPVERVTLERSFHVATLDHDAGEIERRAVAFALDVTRRRRTVRTASRRRSGAYSPAGPGTVPARGGPARPAP